MLTLNNIRVELMGETIIDGFNFVLTQGKVACLYGPSGCGKTTLLRLIAGMIEPEKGKINNLFARTTYLFQEHRLLPWRTAWENIALVWQAAQGADRVKPIEALLNRLELDCRDWHKYPHELSGGMRQRVALGRALISAPDLLLMDEPFSALDFELKQALQALILERVYQQSMSIILVTHDRYEALRLADEIYLLAEKKPTRCQRIIPLTTPQWQRKASYIEARLQPEFWQVDCE